ASKKNGRGPTNMFEVHARKWEDRVAIYCNDKGQPIGPKKARNELTSLLGTIAHDYNWAPLTYTNWQKVPNKVKIWEYVNFREDGEVPSKRKLFERTRSRKEGKTYAKILTIHKQKLRLEALEADESSECQKDLFDEVMGDGRAVRKRLVGIGVSRKKPQENVAGNSLILPKEVMESIKSAVVADVQRELSAEREEIAKEKEAHAARVAEMERAAKEQEMQDDLATQKEPMTLDVIASALAQLRRKDPSLTSEMIAKVIVASATSNSA
ncbi:Tethering factor for nuclear proteasome STS1, partial [Bienertia sinuspersici]